MNLFIFFKWKCGQIFEMMTNVSQLLMVVVCVLCTWLCSTLHQTNEREKVFSQFMKGCA